MFKEYLYYFILVLLIGFGIYSFISLKLWEEMFLLVDFKFFDYEQSITIFYLKYIAILLSISLVIYIILNLIKKIKNRNNVKEV